MEIEARAADHREAKGLRISKGQPILVRRLIFWTKKSEPVLTGTSIYRADRVSYRFTVSA
jgi:DNA-binding GntR family transcriptional regulator